MARNAPATLITYTDTVYNTSGTRTTGSVSWNVGDIIVTMHGAEGVTTLGTPTTTGTGLSFNVLQSQSTAGTCSTKSCYAIATAASSGTISATSSAAGTDNGLAVWIWRGSDGIGTSAESHTTSQTVALTPTDTHSSIMWSTWDFHIATLSAISPTPTNQRQAVSLAAHYMYYVADNPDQASAALINWGVTGGDTVGPFSNLVVEVLGSTLGGAVKPWMMSNNRTGPQALRNIYKSQNQIPYFTPPTPAATSSGGNLPMTGAG